MGVAGMRTYLCLGLAAAGVALLGGCGRGSGPERPNVVVVVLDTLRRDATGSTTAATPIDLRRPGLTPHLDALAAEGVTFRSAWSTAPWTAPSHASMFTGRLPGRHGCTSKHPRLDDGIPTFAERLRDAGYSTGAFFSNVWLAKRTTGVLRGFTEQRETFLGHRGKLTSERGDQGGAETLEHLYVWLNSRSAERPFLLFVNFLEPHLAYDPPGVYRTAALSDLSPRDRVEIDWAHAFNAGLHDPAEVNWSRIVRLYAGDCWFADSLLGRVLERIEALDMRDDTIVIVTSDHGENLGDHGLMDHQFSIDETLLAVPLIVYVPPRWRSRFDPGAGTGGVRDDPVMLTDLYATVLALAGLEPDPDAPHARSLFDDPAPADRPLFAEYAGPVPELLDILRGFAPDADLSRLAPARATVRVGDYRLSVDATGDTLLHDMERDPGQIRDLFRAETRTATALAARLSDLVHDRWESPRDEIEIDESTRRQLESLGYAH